MVEPTLKADPDQKGGYYRRLADVELGLQLLEPGLKVEMLFFTSIFGCEKIARGLVGIHAQKPAGDVYSHASPSMELTKIQAAAQALGLSIEPARLAQIFASERDIQAGHLGATSAGAYSARTLRNKVAHDFGPSHIDLISNFGPDLIQAMRVLRGCVPEVHAFLKARYPN